MFPLFLYFFYSSFWFCVSCRLNYSTSCLSQARLMLLCDWQSKYKAKNGHFVCCEHKTYCICVVSNTYFFSTFRRILFFLYLMEKHITGETRRDTTRHIRNQDGTSVLWEDKQTSNTEEGNQKKTKESTGVWDYTVCWIKFVCGLCVGIICAGVCVCECWGTIRGCGLQAAGKGVWTKT